MPLGTLDRTPPPFFRQGPSALSKLILFSALAVFLMAADKRFKLVEPMRNWVAATLLPAQRVLAVPVELWQAGGAYWHGLRAAQETQRQAQLAAVAVAERAARAEQLVQENARLRALLELRPALGVHTLPAEVLYEAADPYSRKVIIDRGQRHGIERGSPVINEAGVLGQVTRVYPMSAEVTLLVDKDAAIPVLNVRTQQRAAAFGGSGAMELRFTSANADVQVGDALQTNGLDGVYPPGLPVARVTSVDRRGDSGFARIVLAPAAPPGGVRHVLVLQPVGEQLPPRPDEPASAPADKPERQLSGPGRRAVPASTASGGAP